MRDIAALAPADSPPTSLTTYRDAVLQVRREVETLAARKAAPENVVVELRAVLRYYEGAAVAWEAIEGDRERQHLSRKLPVPDSMTQPYFSDSPVASLLEEFDFLDATVARQPTGGRLVEASGLWRPVWARLLLWERGARALDELRTRPAPVGEATSSSWPLAGGASPWPARAGVPSRARFDVCGVAAPHAVAPWPYGRGVYTGRAARGNRPPSCSLARDGRRDDLPASC